MIVSPIDCFMVTLICTVSQKQVDSLGQDLHRCVMTPEGLNLNLVTMTTLPRSLPILRHKVFGSS